MTLRIAWRSPWCVMKGVARIAGRRPSGPIIRVVRLASAMPDLGNRRQHSASSCSSSPFAHSDAAAVGAQIAPFGVAGADRILHLLADAREHGFGHAAAPGDQTGREAMRFVVRAALEIASRRALRACSRGSISTRAAPSWRAARNLQRRSPLQRAPSAPIDAASASVRLRCPRRVRAIRAADRCPAPCRRSRGTSSAHRR